VTQDSICHQGDTAANNLVFRCTFYPYDYSGFTGQAFTPGLPIEVNPFPDSCYITVHVPEIEKENVVVIFPDPANDFVDLKTDLDDFTVSLFNMMGQEVYFAKNSKHLNIGGFSAGLYFIAIRTANDQNTIRKLVITR
jgi:hypothetical protein